MEALKNEELLKLAREDNNLEAKEYFFKRNEKFNWHIVGKFKNTGVDNDDLLSLARLGMVKAFNTFDLSKGFKFATYASMCMNNEILMFLRKNKKHKEVKSIHHTLNIDLDGNELTLEDVIPTEEPKFSSDDYIFLEQVLSEFSKTAKDRDKQILKMRYFDNKNQKDIADELNISQSYISRIEKKIEKQLQKLAFGKNINKSKNEVKGEKNKMGRTNIGKEGYLYIFQNYSHLGNSDIAKILGVTYTAVTNQRKKYKNGELDNVQPKIVTELKEKIESYAPSKKIRKSTLQVFDNAEKVNKNTKEIKEEIAIESPIKIEMESPIMLEEPQFLNIPEEPDFRYFENNKKESIILNNKIDLMYNSEEAASALYGVYQLLYNLPKNSKAKIKLELEVSQE